MLIMFKSSPKCLLKSPCTAKSYIRHHFCAHFSLDIVHELSKIPAYVDQPCTAAVTAFG